MALGIGNIKLTEVKTEIEGNSTATITSLVNAKFSAIPGGWNATYEGSQDRLTNFRGYSQDAPIVTISTAVTSFPAAGGSSIITITCNCQWTASFQRIAGSAPYPSVSLSPTSGTGNDTTTFSVGVNTGGELQYRVTVTTAYPYQSLAIKDTIDFFVDAAGGGGQ